MKWNPYEISAPIKRGQRDGMGREVGAGFRMGDTCTPMADSYQCMAKTTTTNCKVISLPIKINKLIKKIKKFQTASLLLFQEQ